MDKDLYYHIGSLEVLFLDKAQINWKDRVENNKLVYDILRDEVGEQVKGNKKSLEDVKNEYGYNNFNNLAEVILNNLK